MSNTRTTTRTRTRPVPDHAAPADAKAAATAPTRWVRTPTSLLHLVVGAVLLGLGLLVAWRYSNAAAAVNADGEAITRRLPSWLRLLPVVVVESVLVVLPVAVNAVLLARRRFRLLAVVDAAAIAAVVLSEVLVDVVTKVPPEQFPRAYFVDGEAASPNQALLAGALAALVVGLPWLRTSQRRLAWAFLGLHLCVTIVFGDTPAVTWLLDVGVGVTCGAVLCLLVGTPDRRPAAAVISAALDRSGISVDSVTAASVDARGSTPWFATTTSGDRLFVKVLDRDNRSADLLFRLVRFVRLRRTGDQAPFSSLRRTVEHEALLSLRASSVDIPTPELVAVSQVGSDGMLLAYEAIDGSSLDSVDDEALTDDVLDGLWRLVAQLRAAGIAHRDLRLANLFLGDDGRPRLIDFGFAELAADDLLLATDVAELLASTTPRVGVQRAVDAAQRVLGTDALARALPRVQPLALGSATRTALRDEGLLEPLREEVRTRCGLEEVTYEEVARVRPLTVLVVVAVSAALWVLAPELADASGAWDAIRGANWALAGWVLVASAVSYVAAAVALQGAVAEPLPRAGGLLAQLAASFSGSTSPASVGGLTMRVRFLQKQGLTGDDSSLAVGVSMAAGAIVHASLLFLAVEAAGARDTLRLERPVLVVVLVVAGAAAVGSLLLALVPQGRRTLVATLVSGLRSAVGGIRDAAARPRRLFELFGGSIVVTLAYAGALVLAVEALGGRTPVIVVAIVYLTGAIVAAVSPTPGGIGPAEAVYIAGLTSAGEEAAVAVPAVFLFRLATFWLPILPGWWAFRRLESTDRL